MQRALFLALFFVLAPLAAAQESASTVADTNSTAPRSARFVWTGTTLGPKGERFGHPPIVGETTTTFGAGSKPVVARANPRATADGYLKELAAVRLSIEVDRKLDDAQKALDDLCVRAAWKEDYVARFEVLQEVAVARSELAEKRGRKDAALAAIAQLLPDAALRDAFAAQYEFEPASEALLAAETKALAAPAVANAAARLRPGQSAHKAGTNKLLEQETSIEESVRAWLSSGNVLAIQEIGARAAPILEKVVIEGLDFMAPIAMRDALTLLFQLDEARGAQFALAHFDEAGFLWKKRVLRGMESAGVLGNANTWMTGSDPYQKPALIDTMWIPVVERLVRDPEVRLETIRGPVRTFCLQDALTPVMQSALVDAITSSESAEQQAAFVAMENCFGRATVLKVLGSAIQSKNVNVRRYAAQILADEPRSAELLARANDEDPEVRRIVIRSMQARQVRIAAYSANATSTFGQRNLNPEFGVAERAALQKLVVDPDAKVRMDAMGLAASMDPSLETELCLRLARDADVNVRTAMANVLPDTHPGLPSVFLVLAADETPSVRTALDWRFSTWGNGRAIDPLLPALLRRLEWPDPPTKDAGDNLLLGTSIHQALRIEAGMRRLLELAATESGSWLVPWILGSFPWPGPHGGDELPPVLSTVAAEPLATLVRNAQRDASFRNLQLFGQGAHRAALAGVCQRAAWEAVLGDAEATRGLRLRAASILGVEADARCEEGLRALFREDSWKTLGVQDDERDALSDLGKTFRAERRADFFRGLIQDARVNEVPLRWMVGNADKDGLAMAILDRWLDAPRANGSVSLLAEAIAALPASDDPKTIAVLRRCLRYDGVETSVLSVLGRIKKPFGLELLSEGLDANWVTDRGERANVQRAAAGSLTGYMSEDAARRLLAGVTLAAGDTARKACLDGVEQIRTFLDEKKRWDLRDSELEQRAQAVKELLVLLADNDATTRAQAAKSLATLNAAEHLPKLIALLKDKAPEVRTAAQLAIDQLNARSAKKE
ncbi:MAG: HEAT repeat domain-containing protein [Planctomycetes bacterium]|nr:HEAT repeat domain-containing protein [Planctomycetota bacterium]